MTIGADGTHGCRKNSIPARISGCRRHGPQAQNAPTWQAAANIDTGNRGKHIRHSTVFSVGPEPLPLPHQFAISAWHQQAHHAGIPARPSLWSTPLFQACPRKRRRLWFKAPKEQHIEIKYYFNITPINITLRTCKKTDCNTSFKKGFRLSLLACRKNTAKNYASHTVKNTY